MQPDVAWYAEPLGFVVMLGLPLAVTHVVVRWQDRQDRRAELDRALRDLRRRACSFPGCTDPHCPARVAWDDARRTA